MTRVRVALIVALVAATATTAVAQRASGFGRALVPNAAYDGRFTFVRMAYAGGLGRGGSFWAHDYPDGERHLLQILTAVSNVPANMTETNVLTFDDPEMFKYPVIYLVEPGYWSMTDEQVTALRSYLAKGGFLIVDDFPARGWYQFETQMARVFPEGRWVELDVSHPIFHSFFDLATLDIVPAYPALGERPIFRALFKDNDPTARMYVVANFQNDLSEYWEASGTGYYVVANENEAYKVGVNQFIYGLMH